MANHQMYNYGSSYGDYSSSRTAATDPYSRYATTATNPGSLFPSSDVTKYSSAALDYGSSRYDTTNLSSIPPSSSIYSSWAADRPALDPLKRSAEALYHQTATGSLNNFGQNEALFSTNPLVKRPRIETSSNLPIYPQRPGEKDCAHYMLTRTCKFGEACKFDHPIWVPEGGIPDWKEVPLVPISESLPEHPGEPDCPYYMKTQKCKFGFRCKFNHPKDQLIASRGGDMSQIDPSVLPERPSEPVCTFYAKTGKCKFGANCKFHHPKDLQIPSTGQDTGNSEQPGLTVKDDGQAKAFVPFTPALLHNSKGLPIRPGETDCPFYLKTGSCKYGATCRYNHPDRSSATLPIGLVNPAASLIPAINPLLTQASLGLGPTVYPQRPGEIACDFYMKTGHCKFGERCKFHHPADRSAPTSSVPTQAQPTVKLTLAGLPRREGCVSCPFYMKTGTCKYGVACRFDHPPPGEAIAMAAAQGGGTGVAPTSEAEEEGSAEPDEQQ